MTHPPSLSFPFEKEGEAPSKVLDMSEISDKCIFYDIAIRDFSDNRQALVMSFFLPHLKKIFVALLYHGQTIRNLAPTIPQIYPNIFYYGTSYTIVFKTFTDENSKRFDRRNIVVAIMLTSSFSPEAQANINKRVQNYSPVPFVDKWTSKQLEFLSFADHFRTFA